MTGNDDKQALAELETVTAGGGLTPEKIAMLPETFALIAKLQGNYRKQIATLDELKATLVHECGRHLDDKAARDFYIAAKEAELGLLGYKISSSTGRVYAKDTGLPMDHVPMARRIADDIRRARGFEKEAQNMGSGKPTGTP